MAACSTVVEAFKPIFPPLGFFFGKGPFTPSVSVNAAMTLAIPLTLNTMESLQNGLQSYSGGSDSIVFNESSITSTVAALALTLAINEP